MRQQVALALAYLVVSRILELFWSRRNLRLLAPLEPRVVPNDGLAGLVGVNVLWMIGIAAEELLRGPAYTQPLVTRPALALFIASELARFWCMQALGPRWNVRVVVLPGVDLVRHGPYRWMRHPNYVAVGVGLAALPLALGLPFAAAWSLPLFAYAARVRIRVEEKALA